MMKENVERSLHPRTRRNGQSLDVKKSGESSHPFFCESGNHRCVGRQLSLRCLNKYRKNERSSGSRQSGKMVCHLAIAGKRSTWRAAENEHFRKNSFISWYANLLVYEKLSTPFCRDLLPFDNPPSDHQPDGIGQVALLTERADADLCRSAGRRRAHGQRAGSPAAGLQRLV